MARKPKRSNWAYKEWAPSVTTKLLNGCLQETFVSAIILFAVSVNGVNEFIRRFFTSYLGAFSSLCCPSSFS